MQVSSNTIGRGIRSVSRATAVKGASMLRHPRRRSSQYNAVKNRAAITLAYSFFGIPSYGKIAVLGLTGRSGGQRDSIGTRNEVCLENL